MTNPYATNKSAMMPIIILLLQQRRNAARADMVQGHLQADAHPPQFFVEKR
jgi:hypothetical protein